jgi:hypothetical protein
MSDSCRPRKLDPGLAQTYSNPMDLITSTMKSDPVRSAVNTSTLAGASVSAAADMGGGTTRLGSSGCAATFAAGAAASAAAPAAAPFRKFRRFTTGFGSLAMAVHLELTVIFPLYHTA